MRFLIFFAASLVAATSGSADPIATFRQLCIPNAGDTTAVATAAKRAGFNEVVSSGNSFMGFRSNTDESIQVNIATRHSFECAVTTSDMADPNFVSQQFFDSFGLKPRRGKAKGKIGDKIYTFLHDTKGGETFVLYSD